MAFGIVVESSRFELEVGPATSASIAVSALAATLAPESSVNATVPCAGAASGPAPSGSPWQLAQSVTPVCSSFSSACAAGGSADQPTSFFVGIVRFGQTG